MSYLKTPHLSPIAIDTEGPRFDDKEKWRGNAYGDPNDLVCWSWADDMSYGAELWDKNSAETIRKGCQGRLIIVANGKHDMSWMRRYGFSTEGMSFWDVLIAEFIISYQLVKFPSLDYCCEKYNIPKKLDIVKTEYWEKGVDTKDVPWPILQEYAAHDTYVTRTVYYSQLKVMSPAQIKLCKLMSQDMLVLQEMEQNGITYDPALCEQRSKELDEEATLLQQKLSAFYPNIPINFASGDDLSAFLYGGTIVQTIKVHDGFYKTGLRKGQPKLKNQDVEHHLPALFQPIKGSELKKEGYYETNEGILRKLTGKNKPVVDLLLALARNEKLNGTYFKGLPKLNEAMHWPDGKLHGQLNQTLAVSGRLSSSKPNQQNFATEIQDIFISEYK